MNARASLAPAAPAAPQAASRNRPRLVSSDATPAQATASQIPTEGLRRATPRFQPASAPVLPVDPGAESARANAEAAFTSAGDADQVLAAMVAAPPSVKARQASGLGARMEAAQAREQEAFNAALPPLSARMTGEAAPPAPAALTMPPPPAPLAEATPPAAPAPQVDATPEPAPARVAPPRPPLPGDPKALGAAIAALPTSDAVETSAGRRPALPLSGATDPARPATQAHLATTEAETARAAAAQAIAEGPGPEQAQMRAVNEDLPAPAPAPVALAPAAPPEGAAAFAALPLDAETTALFDQAHGPAMAASLQGAEAELATAAEARTQGRDAEVASAQAETARLNAEADAAQQAQVTTRRQEIQDARQDAVTAQVQAVAELDATAATQAGTARAEIDAESSRTETAVETTFSTAETQAEAEVARGTAEAEATRDRAETESESQSWWDRATDWIAAQFSRLAAAISAIFDAVRAAVRRVIEAAKSAALALIDLAARAISAVIDAFAAVLRGLVTLLLSATFPALAAALTAAIDAAVQLAHRAIDAIAEGLKRAVTLALDALAAALDAVLAAWAAAVNGVLSLVQAALTGDWRALARLILTPILLALGIPPEAFFALMGRAETAIDTIVANPQGFVENLLESVKGGIGLFRDNFLHHLIAGVILWLTGPLGNQVQMPQRFDLWGILDIMRQLAGLTLAMLRRVAVRVIGASAVARIEFVMNYIGAAIRDGWTGLWTQLTQDLGQLRDMVLDQIKTFLIEKVVIASILWLASMFNPVGALVKLVMTIWNFIKFLREQVARIYPIVELVITSVADIAAGALEGPKRGVERILGRMLPVVIDLFMTLLGVTGVPDRVQTILRGVQERVETATEALMRRVLALFGVTASGGAAAAPGQIMAPIAFSAGGEAHTILIEDEGETVRPIIRSTPTPLATWLDERMGAPFTELATAKGWTGATLSQKRAEAQALVTAARTAETQLDASAEATENAINAASTSTATEAQKATATTAQADTATKGQGTKSAIVAVLEFWGIAVQPLAQKYAAELAAIRDGPRENLIGQVLPRLDAARYAPLTWEAAKPQIATDPALTDPWKRPANTTGVARLRVAGFDAAIAQAAKDVATTQNLPGASTFLGGATTDAVALNRLFADFLAERLNSGVARTQILRFLLGPGSASLADLTLELQTPIAEATRRMCAPGAEPDADMRQITGSTYFAIFEDAAAARSRVFTHYPTQKPDGSPEGPGERHPLPWFLQHANGSPRAGANRARVADAIRDARPAMHEWIPASIGYAAITATAESLRSRGELDAASGVANFVEFQNRVRTPTRDLIFKPDSFAEVTNAALPYVSRAHSALGRPHAGLTPAEKATAYPKPGPEFGSPVPVLQAHAGGLRARAERGSDLGWTYAQDASPRWHITLQSNLTTTLDGNVEMRTLREVRQAILAYYAQTIWSGRNDLRSTAFDVYQLSGGSSGDLSYGEVKSHAAGRYQASYSDLVTAMNEVLDS